MCRNIKVLYNFEPPATREEIHEAALQYVRKISGFREPSEVNQKAFDQAVKAIAGNSTMLLESLATKAEPKDRKVEAARAKARAAKRFGNG